jgi:hypothetical protein
VHSSLLLQATTAGLNFPAVEQCLYQLEPVKLVPALKHLDPQFASTGQEIPVDSAQMVNQLPFPLHLMTSDFDLELSSAVDLHFVLDSS